MVLYPNKKTVVGQAGKGSFVHVNGFVCDKQRKEGRRMQDEMQLDSFVKRYAVGDWDQGVSFR